jgi:hypothetical protein
MAVKKFQAVREIANGYQKAGLEFFALKVVGRGLFLIIMLMIAFLFVFSLVTDLIPGINEVQIPTIAVSADVDLGSLVSSAFSRVSGAVVSISGVLILAVSAVLTAHALRQGTHRAFAREDAKIRLLQPGTIGAAVSISLIVMFTWLATLATAVRRSAWTAILGQEEPELLINAGKVLVVALAIGVMAGAIVLYVRSITSVPPTGRQLSIAVGIACAVVGASFFLLYSYVGALVNPRASTGVILILTLLAWVNVVVRVYFVGLCWMAARSR